MTYPGYKRARARLHYKDMKARYRENPEHPALRAAMGRMLVYGGDGYPAAVPQKGSATVEAIAWHRESGAQPGYWNRTQRGIK